MMQNTDYQFANSSKSLREIPLFDTQNLRASLASSLESSDSKRADFRSSIDLDAEPGSHNSSSAWKINSENDHNIKVTPAYIGGDPTYNGYFEEFTTQDPIDFDKFKESEEKYEDHSSSSSSLSKSSKKISKLQKEEVANTSLKYERAKGKKNPWQPSEDNKVIELVAHYGQSWALIAAALTNRTGKQVRDRYLNYLRADIKDEDFTIQEDRLLLSLYYQWGHKWSKIASQLPGRTECQVKNRFYAHIKKRLAFPDILDNKTSQRNDMFFENNHAKENRFMFEENKESGFPVNVNDPTDVISYESKNRTITQMSQSIHSNQHSYSFQSTHFNENLQSAKKIEGEEVSIDFLSSFNNANAFCDDALLKTEVKADMKVESDPEFIHHQLQNDLKIRERAQRYEELMRRKKALEYFYSKTLKEMSDLGINDFSPVGPK